MGTLVFNKGIGGLTDCSYAQIKGKVLDEMRIVTIKFLDQRCREGLNDITFSIRSNADNTDTKGVTKPLTRYAQSCFDKRRILQMEIYLIYDSTEIILSFDSEQPFHLIVEYKIKGIAKIW